MEEHTPSAHRESVPSDDRRDPFRIAADLDRHPRPTGLSARERTVLLLISRGLSNKLIAGELQITPETVKSHAKSIFLKLSAQTRAQAVFRAIELGLIAPR